MDSKIAHLEMIQTIISRMANNSFSLKSWTVTLVSGIFILASKETDKLYFLVAYIPIIVFWLLDAYYLLQERLYRELYNKVRTLSLGEIDFDMNISLDDFHTEKNTYSCCLLSKTIIGFYLPLALVTVGIIIVTHL